MVEYVVGVFAGLVLLGLLAGHFLLQGVSYGPRTRRAMALFALPAGAATVAIGAVAPGRPVWLRTVLCASGGLAVYLGVAAAAVTRWRNRKITALVGDVGALRRRIAARRREVDRLFWEQAGAAPSPEPDEEVLPASEVECASTLRQWLEEEPKSGRARAAQVDGWRAEFRRCAGTELRARARVLEAVAADTPDLGEQLALRAKLATLALIYRERRRKVRQRPGRARPAGDLSDVPLRLARLQAELARLQEELAAMLHQRGVLAQRRLPLD